MAYGYKVFEKLEDGALLPITNVGRSVIANFAVGVELTAPVGGFFLYTTKEAAMRLVRGISRLYSRPLCVRRVEYSDPMAGWCYAMYTTYGYSEWAQPAPWGMIVDAWTPREGRTCSPYSVYMRSTHAKISRKIKIGPKDIK